MARLNLYILSTREIFVQKIKRSHVTSGRNRLKSRCLGRMKNFKFFFFNKIFKLNFIRNQNKIDLPCSSILFFSIWLCNLFSEYYSGILIYLQSTHWCTCLNTHPPPRLYFLYWPTTGIQIAKLLVGYLQTSANWPVCPSRHT